MERWKPVVGYEDRYEVSDFGAVRALNFRRTGKIRLLRQSKDSHGYWGVTLYNGDGLRSRRSIGVHQLVAAAFLGQKPERYDINHIDGIAGNNVLNNLEYVTRSENLKHSVRIGIRKRFYPKRDPNTGRALSRQAALRL